MPAVIKRAVRKQNVHFLHNRIQYSVEFFQFMRKLVTANAALENTVCKHCNHMVYKHCNHTVCKHCNHTIVMETTCLEFVEINVEVNARHHTSPRINRAIFGFVGFLWSPHLHNYRKFNLVWQTYRYCKLIATMPFSNYNKSERNMINIERDISFWKPSNLQTFELLLRPGGKCCNLHCLKQVLSCFLSNLAR